MRKFAALAAGAAALATGLTSADVKLPAPPAGFVQESFDLSQMDDQGLRGPGIVIYETFPPTTPPFGNLFRLAANAPVVGQEISLSCGPATGVSATNPVTITSIQFAIRAVKDNTPAGSVCATTPPTNTTPADFDVLIDFYDDVIPTDINNTGPAFSNPIGTRNVLQVRNNQPTPALTSTGSITFPVVDLTANNIVVDDPSVGVVISYVLPGTTTPFPSTQDAGTGNPPCDYGVTGLFYDITQVGGNGSLSYGDGIRPTTCGTANGILSGCEVFSFAAPAVANMVMRLTAASVPTLPPFTPPVATCLGSLIDDDLATPAGPIVINNALSAGQVQWYKFTLTETLDSSTGGGAGEYLDIHTDGSNVPDADPPGTGPINNDTYIALYDAAGDLVADNDDAPQPTGTNYFMSALSFGDNSIPRPLGGSGLALAGDNGELPKGEYYLAASGFPVNRLQCRFDYLSTSVDTGTIRLNILANLVNPCAGDLNGDKVVNESDLGILLGAWQSGACGDLNRDGQTAEADLGILLGVWQQTCGPN